MTQRQLKNILKRHKMWIEGKEGSVPADLSGADLSGADLSGADLSGAILARTDLRRANLTGSNLALTVLAEANLSEANLSNADIRLANLNRAKLRSTNLKRANLSGAGLRGADMGGACLLLSDLSNADLSGADLRVTIFIGTNLSRAKGMLSACDYMASHFERSKDGYIAYKTFDKEHASPAEWVIAPGSVIAENVDANRAEPCGCGINVAPLDWVKREYGNSGIWKVLIRWEWLPGVVVPYNTDGKIRCERVELLEMVEETKN